MKTKTKLAIFSFTAGLNLFTFVLGLITSYNIYSSIALFVFIIMALNVVLAYMEIK